MHHAAQVHEEVELGVIQIRPGLWRLEQQIDLLKAALGSE
jgi:hypothetical protein